MEQPLSGFRVEHKNSQIVEQERQKAPEYTEQETKWANYVKEATSTDVFDTVAQAMKARQTSGVTSQSAIQNDIDAIKREIDRVNTEVKRLSGSYLRAGGSQKWNDEMPQVSATLQQYAKKLEQVLFNLQTERDDLFYSKQADEIAQIERYAAKSAGKTGSSAPLTKEDQLLIGQEAYGALYALRNGIDWNQDAQAMTDGQKRTLMTLADQGDMLGVKRYWELISRTVHAERQKQASAEMEAFAHAHPILGTAVNAISSPLRAFGFIANAEQAASNALTGEYEPTDRNSKWFSYAHTAQDTARGIHQAGEEAGGKAGELLSGLYPKAEELGKKAGGFLADTGLSIVNMGGQAALGPAALPVMGLSAAGGTTLETLEQGGTPEQAFMTGTNAGVAEVLTERLPMEQLLGMSNKAPESVRDALSNVGKVALSEGIQEGVTEVANTWTDQAVMRENSRYEWYVRELMGSGMGEEDTRRGSCTG